MGILNHIKQYCLEHGLDSTYWIGYSGGMDSHVLLHAISQLREHYPLKIKAIHIHHGLSPDASHWQQHSEKICRELKIEYETESIRIKKKIGESPENAARKARYAVLREKIQSGDIFLSAHHEEDQAETVLLQLLRGAGPKGLSAMPKNKSFGKGWHGRPLLAITHDEIKQYAVQHHLQWIEDESNQNEDFSRNFIRHRIMPILKDHWPTASKMISRTAAHCAALEPLLENIVAPELKKILGDSPEKLSIQKCREVDSDLQSHLIRAWLRTLHLPLPSTKTLHHIQKNIMAAREDKMPEIKWNGIALKRYQQYLYVIHSSPPHDPTKIVYWEDVTKPLEIQPIGTFHPMLTIGKGLKIQTKKISIRFRQHGESCDMPERGGHHTLKKLFQEWAIPPWERSRIPLIYSEENLIGVANLFLNKQFTADKNETGVMLHFTPVNKKLMTNLS